MQSPLVPASHNLLHGVYEAAKPPRDTPDVCGGCAFEQLVPTPRPYQRRAVDWMIRRERGGAPAASKRGDGACTKEDDACAKALHPLWSELGDAAVYVNWNTGQLTRRRFDAHVAEPSGGILADEMGLGKTVELMMCVLAHRYVPPAAVKEEKEEETALAENTKPVDGEVDDVAAEEEVVGCVCGNTDDDYEGMWLACDECHEWSHARCVGYTKADETRHRKKAEAAVQKSIEARAALDAAEEGAEGADTAVHDVDEGEHRLKGLKMEADKATAEAEAASHAPPFLCGRCVATRAGEVVSGPCGATLVVCPAPILPQWRRRAHASREARCGQGFGVRGPAEGRGGTEREEAREGKKNFFRERRLRRRPRRRGRRAHHLRRPAW